MKEDVLEQVVEDYLQLNGYFTQHNLRFKPAKDEHYVSTNDSVASDIDVIGYNPLRKKGDRVWVVSCKAWQSGFSAQAKLDEMRGVKANGKRETWKAFREVWEPRWAAAFRSEIERATGESRFRYSIAVTKLNGGLSAEQAADLWRSDPTIQANLAGSTMTFLTMRSMWDELQQKLTTTPASSEIGRVAQLLKAAGIEA